MDIINISDRLKKIISLIPKCDVFADIGTDHGYLAIRSVQEKIARKAIASDIAKMPLEQAKHQINKYNLIEDIDIRLGSGLEPIEVNEVDGIVVAGMGGKNIYNILESKKEVSTRLEFLILQPQNNSEAVRFWLIENGYKIVQELLVKENNIIYQIIKAVPGKSANYSNIEMQYGIKKTIDNKSLLKEYLDQEINKCRNILIEMNKSENSDIIDKRNT